MGNLRTPEFKGKTRFESIFSEVKNSYMYRGETSEDVRKVQKILLKENPDALPKFGADSVFGGETESAVYSLQKRNNYKGEIKEDGIVGAQTIAILDVVMVNDLVVQTIENSPIQFNSVTSINPIYWKTDIPNDKFHQRKDHPAWEAVYSLYNSTTALECFMAINVFYAKALLDTLGKDAFSEYFKWNSDSDPGLYVIKPLFASNDRLIQLFKELSFDALQMRKGDWEYYKNDERYGRKHPHGVWQGENAVYVGNSGTTPMFRGHGLSGALTEEELFGEMKKNFDVDSQDSDSDPTLKNAKTYRKTPGSTYGVIGFEYIYRFHLGKISLIKRNPKRPPFTS